MPLLCAIDRKVHEQSSGERVWGWILKSSVPVLLAAIVSVGAWGTNLNGRMRVIETNGFTDAEAAKLRSDLMKDLPPEWLREDIKEIKDRLRRLEERKEPK